MDCTVHMLTQKLTIAQICKPKKKSMFKQFTGSNPRHSSEHAGERCKHSLSVHYLVQIVTAHLFLSIHIFNTDKCWELIYCRRHDSCNCSLIHSWIWNHSDLGGSFYSNVSSEASGKKKNLSDQSEPHFSGESTLFSLHFPLQWGHSINHSAKRYLYSVAAKTLMSVAVRMNCHDSADLPEKVCFLFQKSQQKYLKKNVEKLIWIMKITSNWRFGHFTFTATWEMSCCNLHL